jgi:hypothetical protein
MVGLVDCPACSKPVLPKSNGECPACLAVVFETREKPPVAANPPASAPSAAAPSKPAETEPSQSANEPPPKLASFLILGGACLLLGGGMVLNPGAELTPLGGALILYGALCLRAGKVVIGLTLVGTLFLAVNLGRELLEETPTELGQWIRVAVGLLLTALALEAAVQGCRCWRGRGWW